MVTKGQPALHLECVEGGLFGYTTNSSIRREGKETVHFAKRSPMKRASLGVVVAAVILLGAGPAQAAGPGAGVFTGHEYAPNSTLNPPIPPDTSDPSLLCALFEPTADVPLVHELAFEGTFHNTAGTGTARYENTTHKYNANPEGTYDPTNTSCNPTQGTYAVPSTSMVINFSSVPAGTTYSCNGSGSYERRATSVYILTFTGTCTSGTTSYPTTVTFTGAQVPCDPVVGCVTDPTASSVMAGAYVQTHG